MTKSQNFIHKLILTQKDDFLFLIEQIGHFLFNGVLRGENIMIRVCFVCHGNICRSPMAEFVLKDMTKKLGINDKFYIASAATSSEEIWNGIGNLVHYGTREKLATVGISCEGKRAVQLKKSDYDDFDFFIGMDDANIKNMKRILGKDKKIYKLLDFVDNTSRNIADPWYTGNFDLTYENIVEGCNALLNYLSKNGLI